MTPARAADRLVAVLAILLVHGYRLLVSSWLPASCRYRPTCSAYALEALRRHGGLRGGLLAIRRIGRCHPWGGSGFDPVPDPVPASARPEDDGEGFRSIHPSIGPRRGARRAGTRAGTASEESEEPHHHE